jgi:hypothetical protein
MDIDQIEPGEDFIEIIHEKLKMVQVAVVLIGKHWLDIKDTNGKRRLEYPDDWVRLEIASLLERKVRIIPILVGNAKMPMSSQLPDNLLLLAQRQAYEISDQRYHADVDKLILALEKIMFSRSQQLPADSILPQGDQSRFNRFVSIFVLICILLIGYFSWNNLSLMPRNQEVSIGNLISPVTPKLNESTTKRSTINQSSEEYSTIEQNPGTVEPIAKLDTIITPGTDELKKSGTVSGIVSLDNNVTETELTKIGRLEIFLTEFPQIRGIVDHDGFYMLRDVPTGLHSINIKQIDSDKIIKKVTIKLDGSGVKRSITLTQKDLEDLLINR